MKRKIWLDNLRTCIVVLVMIYHVFYIYNGVGVPGGIPAEESIPLFDSFCTLVYPWFMVLLFLLAGMSARYSLKARGKKAFIKERTAKLLLPSTAGLFVIHWITGYLNIKIGGGLEYIPAFLVYPISVISGQGPLWFAQLLFLFSALLLLILAADRNDKLYVVCGKCGYTVLLLLALPVWGAAQILNMPVITMYRFGIYFLCFIIGYFLLSQEEILKKAEKMRYVTLILAVVFGVLYMLRFNGENFSSDSVLKDVRTNAYLWFTSLTLIGFSQKYINMGNRVTAYIAKNSFGYYVLHYPVLMSVCALMHIQTSLGVLPKIYIALICEVLLTVALNEVIKRIPAVRFLVLGIRKKAEKNEIQVDN